ncbi:hypothetical protein QB94_13215 [Salmonella enterica subsp. enterica serovar Newport]|nr:hypothetical protein [Salmonella enterica subsp. enterica serovar Newport]
MLGKAAPRWQQRKASQLKLRNLAFAGFFVSRLIYFLLVYPKRVISVSYPIKGVKRHAKTAGYDRHSP